MKNNRLRRFEGRLFAEAGRIYLVVEVDEAAGIGRVSFSIDGQQQVAEMPLEEIARRISLGANLVLDNVSDSELSKRITRKRDGWYFAVREGLKGPYRSGAEAERELSQYVLTPQT